MSGMNHQKRPIGFIPPRPQKKLYGRKKQFDELISRLKNPSDTREEIIRYIYGPSGVGKTSFAIEIAHYFYKNYKRLAADNRFEAIIWVSAQPFVLFTEGFVNLAQPSRTLSDFITSIASVLGAEDVLKAVPEDQISFLLKALSKFRILLVADDLENVVDDRVLGLIYQLPSTVNVIITSRERKEIGTPMYLRPLDSTESLKVITQALKNKKVKLTTLQQENLIIATGGIPLAILLSISLLRYYKADLLIEGLTNLETDPTIGIYDQMFVYLFEKSWEKVSDLESKLLFAITLFRSGVKRESIEDIFKSEADLVDISLRKLDFLSLVSLEDKRYSMLPLAKTYVGKKFKDKHSEETEIRNRWLDYLKRYIKSAHRSNRWEQIFNCIDLEIYTFIDMIYWASKSTDQPNLKIATVIFYEIIYYLFSRGYWSIILEQKDWVGEKLLEQGMIEEYLDVCLTWPLRIYISQKVDKSNIQELFHIAKKKLGVFKGENDYWKAIIEFNEASILRRQNKDWNAEKKLRRAIKVFDAHSAQRWKAEAYQRLGNTYAKIQWFDEARSAYEESSRVAQTESGKPWAQEIFALSKGNIGILFNRLRDYENAKEYIESSLSMLAQKSDIAIAYMELAISNYYLANYVGAIYWANRSQKLSEGLGLQRPIAESIVDWENNILPKLKSLKYTWFWQLLNKLRLINIEKIIEKRR